MKNLAFDEFRAERAVTTRPTGNTEVIAANSISSLKGRDPAHSGFTPKARSMFNRVIPDRVTDGTGKRVASAAAVLFALALLFTPYLLSSTERASADHAPLEAIFGTVVEVSPPTSITIATDSGVETITIPGNDVFTGDITSIENISEGDRAVGTVHVEPDGTLVVRRLLIVPDLSKIITRHILGVILDDLDGEIVLQDQQGNSITVSVPEGMTVPAVGTVVTTVVELDRATGLLQVQAFDRVEDAVERLQAAKDRATDEDLIEKLEDLLERARDQHLSALERAKENLERAQEALAAAIAERDEAERRIAEVQARFDALRSRYVQEASERNERLPELRTGGILTYNPDEWEESTGTFTLVPQVDGAESASTRAFTWNSQTLAIVPVDVTDSDPASPAITSTTARSVALPLNDAKSLIPSGARVLVQYDPNSSPAAATLVTVLPPEIPEAIQDALERERLRSISGVITLVEKTPGLDTVTGVIAVANRKHDVKVVAKVTGETDIEIDGKPADFDQLAAGMSVDVDFASPDSSITGDGRLNALRIRASSEVDADEVHVAGVITGLDVETRTVGILTNDGNVVRAPVPEGSEIIKDGAPSRFSSIEIGNLVLDATRFNRGTLLLTKLVVQSPRDVEFSGSITGLGLNPERVTVATSTGRVLQLLITDDTELRNGRGEDVEFSNLNVGNRVTKGKASPVQRDGRTVLVAQELVIGEANVDTTRGTVLKVDPASGTILVEITRVSTAGTTNTANLASTISLHTGDDGQSVLFKNDSRIRTLEPIVPGDIVESASYFTSSNTIIKMSVVSADLRRVRGTVDSASGRGLVISTTDNGSVGLAVTDETVITLNGRRIGSVTAIQKGDIVAWAVFIANPSNRASGTALRVTIIRPGADSPSDAGTADQISASRVETTVVGVIEEIDDEEWTIAEQEFEVNSETRFFGAWPQEGLIAKATLVVNDEGEFVATSVSVAGRPDVNPTTRPAQIQPVEPGDAPDLVRILGEVREIVHTPDGLMVIVIDGIKVTVRAETVIAGDAEVGARALAVIKRTPAGTVIATSIVFIGDEARPSLEAPPEDDTDASNEPDDNKSVGGDADIPGIDSGPADDKSDDGTEDTEQQVETIRIERISGRVAISNDKVYLLTAKQADTVRLGQRLTIAVTKVDADDIDSTLSASDLAELAGNPLFETYVREEERPLFVSVG